MPIRICLTVMEGTQPSSLEREGRGEARRGSATKSRRGEARTASGGSHLVQNAEAHGARGVHVRVVESLAELALFVVAAGGAGATKRRLSSVTAPD